MATPDIKTTSDCESTDALLRIALDLNSSAATGDRYTRLVQAVRKVVPCDATALLRLHNGRLTPVVISGLSPDTMGRSFDPKEHPRLRAILSSREPVKFEANDPRPDPYDGLIDGVLPGSTKVHSCMGCSLYVGNDLIGALTADSLKPGAFDAIDNREFAIFAALAAANMRTVSLIDSLEKLAEKRGLVARQLVLEALKRGGGELLGTSQEMTDLKTDLKVVAKSDLTVLVTGETGTGKELVARTIHARSLRSNQPLAYVNCAALPESIAESELFGHLKGAYTGAFEKRAGKFELADGGTLFLDEIGELPLSIQPKLLRALQSGEIQRVGSDQNLKVDVRIIAATNRNLVREVKTGRFRTDLYHRLSVYPIHVPPLRERTGDIALLSGHFLDQARIKLGLGPTRLSNAARHLLEVSQWPGNVRELEHVIMRGALRAAGGDRGSEVIVDTRHLDLLTESTSTRVSSSKPAEDPYSQLAYKDAVEEFKRNLISNTVNATDGNWAEAARRLGLHRSNLYRMAQKMNLK